MTGSTRDIFKPSARVVMTAVFVLAAAVAVPAHVIRSLDRSDRVTAFVSSPTAGSDVPIRIVWGVDTNLRGACFNVANTSVKDPITPDDPRVTSVGLELPGSLTGFALLAPLDAGWRLIEGVEASLGSAGHVTLDFAIVASVNPTGRTAGSPEDPAGIPSGQPGVRGAGTRFCVSGPFPDSLPDLATADPADTVPTTIEGLLNGVVVGFHGVDGSHQGRDAGVWFPPPGTSARAIPLY